MKPGAIFVDLTWTLTDSYDPENPKHEKAKHDVMVSLFVGRRLLKLQFCIYILYTHTTISF